MEHLVLGIARGEMAIEAIAIWLRQRAIALP
jgi:hypothetical protein